MESQLGISQIKQQATFFLKDKIKAARLAFTDVTPAQLLAEEATNSDEWGPETKVMSEISDAARMNQDCRKIMQVLRQRLDNHGGKYWRQLNKTLILLEYLLTHGPQDMVDEISSDRDAIEELTRFEFLDERGFDRGSLVRRKASRVLELITQGKLLKEERERAQKLSRGILGFGGFSSGSGAFVSTNFTIEGFGSMSAPKTSSFHDFDGSNNFLLQDEAGKQNRDSPKSAKRQLNIHWHPFEKATQSSDGLNSDWHPFESSDYSTPCINSEWRPFEGKSLVQASLIQSGSEGYTHDHPNNNLQFSTKSAGVFLQGPPQVSGMGKDGDKIQSSSKLLPPLRAANVPSTKHFPDLIDM